MFEAAAVVSALHGSPEAEPKEEPVKLANPNILQRIQIHWNKHPIRYRNYVILVSSFTVYMIVCVCWYTYYEGWEPSVSLSFVVETMTTVGFGYHAPTDDNSRLFTIIVMIFGIFVIFGGISSALTNRLVDFKKRKKVQLDENVGLVFKDLERRFWTNVLIMVGSLFVASAFLVWLEEWTFAKALYFAVQTATSVGYGDIPLHQGGTHVFVEVYTFFSTILLAFAIGNLHGIYKEKKALKKALIVAERKQTLDKIKLLDTGNGVSRDTFILAVLEQLGTINRDTDIEPWAKKFEELDRFNTGVIRLQEIEQFSMSEYLLAAEQIERVKSIEQAPPAVFDLRATFSDALGMNMGLNSMGLGAESNGSGVQAGAGATGGASGGASHAGGVSGSLRRTTGAPQSVTHIGGAGAVGGARGSSSAAADSSGPFGLPSRAESNDENL